MLRNVEQTQLSLSMPGQLLVSILSVITVPLPWCAPDPVLESQPCDLLYLLEDHMDFRNHLCDKELSSRITKNKITKISET